MWNSITPTSRSVDSDRHPGGTGLPRDRLPFGLVDRAACGRSPCALGLSFSSKTAAPTVHRLTHGCGPVTGGFPVPLWRNLLTRELVYTGFMSLDGVVDSPGGKAEGHRSGGWVMETEFVPEAYSLKAEELAETTALMFGRRSYEAFASFWRDSEDHVAYKELPKYVVSTTLADDAADRRVGPDHDPAVGRGHRGAQAGRRRRHLHPRQRRTGPAPVGRRPHRPVQPARVPGAAGGRARACSAEPIATSASCASGSPRPTPTGWRSSSTTSSAERDRARAHRRCPREAQGPCARRSVAMRGRDAARRSTRARPRHRSRARRTSAAALRHERARSARRRLG